MLTIANVDNLLQCGHNSNQYFHEALDIYGCQEAVLMNTQIGSRNHRYLTSISRGSSTSPLLNLCEFLTVPKSNSFQRRASLAHLDSCMSVIVHFWKNGAKRVAEFRFQPFGRLINLMCLNILWIDTGISKS
jgi:hypothetical protein